MTHGAVTSRTATWRNMGRDHEARGEQCDIAASLRNLSPKRPGETQVQSCPKGAQRVQSRALEARHAATIGE